MFARKRKDSLADRALEERLFDIIAAELREGVKKDGLWLKAVSKCGGNESRRESEYVKLRMQSLKDEMEISAIRAAEAELEPQRLREEAAEKKKAMVRERIDLTISSLRAHGYVAFPFGPDRFGPENWRVGKRFCGKQLCQGIDELEEFLERVVSG